MCKPSKPHTISQLRYTSYTPTDPPNAAVERESHSEHERRTLKAAKRLARQAVKRADHAKSSSFTEARITPAAVAIFSRVAFQNPSQG